MRLNLDVHTKRKSKNLREGYAITRVSTSERARTQHGSLEQQWNRIARWEKLVSEETGLKYNVIHHVQEDTSGKRENTHRRLELLELSRRIESGSIDFIVVEKLDRLSRDEIFNLILAEKLVKFGVELFLIDGGKVDFRQSGDRWKFKIDNIRAGEYSEDLSQKVSIKQREAMVNNGKDPTPVPALGLDKHDVWVGMYKLNKSELKVAIDIMKQFVIFKGARKATLDYCTQKKYLTKIWWTEPKVSKDGRRLPPRQIGGQSFSWDSLLRLLKCTKYRGEHKFYDYYNQFPDLQNKDGFVTWEYHHKKEHGDIIDPELLKQVDELVQTHEWKPRVNEFYLSGVLLAPNGTKYYGEAANGAKNYYYYNKSSRHRIITGEIHKIVENKLKALLLDTGKLEKLILSAKSQKKMGMGSISDEKQRVIERLSELEKVDKSFSDSVRALALKGGDNLEGTISMLLEEKEKAAKEAEELRFELHELSEKEKSYKEDFRGHQLSKFLKMTLKQFDKMPDIEKKILIQAVFPQILVHQTNEGVDLEITISLDPFKSPSPQSKNGGGSFQPCKVLQFPSVYKNSSDELDTKKPHFLSSQPSGGEEDKKWGFLVNGRTDWI